MGLFKKLEKKMNSTTSDSPETRKTHVNGKNSATNGSLMHVHANPDVPRQQSHPLMRTEEKRLPNPDVSMTWSNGPASTVTATNPAISRRPVNAAQDVGAEMRPSMQRMPTAQSVKECPHDIPMKVAEDPPQLDTVVPGPLLRKETALDSSSVHDELARNLAAVRDREAELANAMKEKDERIQEQDIRIQDLLNSRNECMSKITDLEAQLRDEQGKNTELRQAWQKSTTALTQAKRPEASYKVDDKALKALYQELVFNVSNWADAYCVPDMKQLSNSEFRPFWSLTVVPDKYLRHKRTQPLLLKSLVMKMLVNDIFTISTDNESGVWWAGNRAREMRKLYNTLMPAEPHDIPGLLKKGNLRSADVKDFSNWKAKSALLLSQRVEASVMNSNIDMLVREWKQILIPFVKRNEAGVWRDLGDVIEKAINLDLEMSKSRSLFSVRRWSAGDLEKLDQARLETAVGFQAAQPGMTVELVLAPYVTKTGRADGDAFETMLLISNWIVISTENRENMKKSTQGG